MSEWEKERERKKERKKRGTTKKEKRWLDIIIDIKSNQFDNFTLNIIYTYLWWYNYLPVTCSLTLLDLKIGKKQKEEKRNKKALNW